MATLILARHGRTAANASGVLAGRSKGVHLDETGTTQARNAAARLEGLTLAAAVTSPLERCRETTKLLLAGAVAPAPAPQAERRLLECDYGDWTGQELKVLAKEKLWRVVQSQPSAAVFPAGESMAQMSSRAVAAIRDWDARVEAEHGPEAVWLAVSHGDVIKAILADALGLHLDSFQRISVDPASLSVVRYTPHRSFVVTSNSHAGGLAHLAPAPKKRGTRRRGAAGAGSASSDAVVGGGAGPDVHADPATATA